MASIVKARSNSPTALLALLTAVVFINYTDRYVLGILIEPIRLELGLGDTQIGLLTGAGFALLYSAMAVPIARAAERWNRLIIVFAAICIWSLGTLLGGLATGFATLLLARLVVGFGEAGGIPPSMSMISDVFPARRRATAMAIFGMGGSAGAAIAPMLGGWLEARYGWRLALVFVGLLGVPVAVSLLLLREPKRGAADGVRAEITPLPFTVALKRLFSRPAFVWLMPAMIAMSLAEYSLLLWGPALFHRTFLLDPAELGRRMTVFQGLPFFAGTFVGGFLADALAKRDARWIIWLPMIAAMLVIPGVVSMLVVRDLTLSLILLTLPSFVSGLYIGPCYALIQNLAAPHSRATASAVLALVVNLIGAGLGPLMLGGLSDLLASRFGVDSLRWAFLILVPLYLAAAASFGAIGRHLIRDIADVANETRASAEA